MAKYPKIVIEVEGMEDIIIDDPFIWYEAEKGIKEFNLDCTPKDLIELWFNAGANLMIGTAQLLKSGKTKEAQTIIDEVRRINRRADMMNQLISVLDELEMKGEDT